MPHPSPSLFSFRFYKTRKEIFVLYVHCSALPSHYLKLPVRTFHQWKLDERVKKERRRGVGMAVDK
jgi:hypothetical protein